MRRFLITSPKFTGQAELLYDERLCCVDLQNCLLTDQQMSVLFNNLIFNVADIELLQKKIPVTIIEADYEVSFDMFWKKYNKKINKLRCLPLFEKMEKSMQVKAYFGIDAYHRFLKKETWRSKADPETYLRNQYWDNEYK